MKPLFAVKCHWWSSASVLALRLLRSASRRRYVSVGVAPPPPSPVGRLRSDPRRRWRRKLGHIESWRRLPEEGCILGQLHVLPSVLLHNSKDVERRERGGSNRERGEDRRGRINLSGDHGGDGGQVVHKKIQKKKKFQQETCEEHRANAELREEEEEESVYIHHPRASHNPLSATWMTAGVGKSPGSQHVWVYANCHETRADFKLIGTTRQKHVKSIFHLSFILTGSSSTSCTHNPLLWKPASRMCCHSVHIQNPKQQSRWRTVKYWNMKSLNAPQWCLRCVFFYLMQKRCFYTTNLWFSVTSS